LPPGDTRRRSTGPAHRNLSRRSPSVSVARQGRGPGERPACAPRIPRYVSCQRTFRGQEASAWLAPQSPRTRVAGKLLDGFSPGGLRAEPFFAKGGRSGGAKAMSGRGLSLPGGASRCQGAPSPFEGDPSPRRGDTSPCQGEPSPFEGDPSPRRGDASPCQGDPSPFEGDPSPCQGDPSPRWGTPPPAIWKPPLKGRGLALPVGPSPCDGRPPRDDRQVGAYEVEG